MRPESNGRTICIAEDEPEVRNYLSVALRCRGYDVEFAQNGDEALQCVRGDHNRLSLVLLDPITTTCKLAPTIPPPKKKGQKHC